MTPETQIRIGAFVGLLGILTIWESIAPRRSRTECRRRRWTSHFGLALVNAVTLRLIMPMGAVGIAVLAEVRGWGLFHQFDLPGWLTGIACVVLMDLVVYLQHVIFHALPFLWQLHSVHHADVEFDVTTGLRFHTFEILLSFGIKSAAIILLGAAPTAVLVFEVLLNGLAMFNHSNIKIPQSIDRWLRKFVVTPDMHRVHHSVIEREANSNFGFNLACWDLLFGTYRDQPQDGHQQMSIGVSWFRDHRAQGLTRLLTMPFAKFHGRTRERVSKPTL